MPVGDRDWLVIDVAKQPNEMHCQRCGDRHPMPTKSTAKMIEAMIKTFAKQHAKCQPGDASL